MVADKFTNLQKTLKALGPSDERIDELIGWIRTWLLDDDEKKAIGRNKDVVLATSNYPDKAELEWVQRARPESEKVSGLIADTAEDEVVRKPAKEFIDANPKTENTCLRRVQ